jgi:hypothetical protein
MSRSTATQQDCDDVVAILLSGDDDCADTPHDDPRHGLEAFVFKDPDGHLIDSGSERIAGLASASYRTKR